jgi:hypothetical protein
LFFLFIDFPRVGIGAKSQFPRRTRNEAKSRDSGGGWW